MNDVETLEKSIAQEIKQAKILIVDDNPENLRTLKALLEDNQFEVYAAINGQLAIDAAQEIQPELILLDIMMPGINGYEVCRTIKSNKATTNIPVLFISALDESMDKVKGFKYGAVDFITKPFFADEVIARINTHITLFKTQKKLMKANKSLEHYTEELKAKNRDIESFTYSVSHDLKAPLRHINGYSQILLEEYDEKLDQQGKNYLNRIRNGAEQMSHLIDDLLKLSRISQSEVNRSPTNLSRIAGDINKNLVSSYSNKTVDVVIQPNIISNCDYSLINIALTNLFDNAWKYSSKNPDACIKFSHAIIDGEDIYSISDNGIGFNMQFADRLFQPFQRLHTNQDYEGTGIGLVIVARIIQLHGGRIWAESEVDSGTTFYFTLMPK